MITSASKHLASDRELARVRLDARLQPLRRTRGNWAMPRGGWVRAIRRALGISLADMAERLGITSSSAVRLEGSEQKQTIQLDSLRRAAAALDCELVYVLIPKQSLQTTVELRRLEVARGQGAKVRTHMSLEGQETSGKDLEKWREDRAVARLRDRDLWKKTK